MSERSHEQTVVSMAVMAMHANERFDEETMERLLQVFDVGYVALEAKLSKMEEALGNLGNAVHLAQLFLGGLRPSAVDVDEITQDRIDQFIRLTNSLVERNE